MSEKPKQNRWQDEEKWQQFIAPLNNFLDNFKVTNEDEEEFVLLYRMQIKRGNRDADKRPDIVKILKVEFAEHEFVGWAQVRLADGLVKKMKKSAKKNRASHIAFFKATSTVPTYTKDKVKYQFRDATHYADAQEKADLTKFKTLHKNGLDWANPVYAVEIEAKDDEEE